MNYLTDELRTYHVLSDPELEECVSRNVIKMIDAFHRGHDTGLTWNKSWEPGGPSIYTGTKYPEWKEQDEREYHAWWAGFRKGIKYANQHKV